MSAFRITAETAGAHSKVEDDPKATCGPTFRIAYDPDLAVVVPLAFIGLESRAGASRPWPASIAGGQEHGRTITLGDSTTSDFSDNPRYRSAVDLMRRSLPSVPPPDDGAACFF